jgi:hypothetical protein
MNSHDSIIEQAKVLCLAKIRSAFEINNIRFSFRGVLRRAAGQTRALGWFGHI